MTSSHRSNLSTLTEEQEKQFQAWRAEALEKMPYFARIIFSLRVLNAPGLGTWAVDDGYRMYVDFDAVAKKGLDWNVESVLHEASHLFADHRLVRAELGINERDGRLLKTLNVGCDLSINDDLDEAGCTTFRSDKMLPEFIGEPNNQTPHYYFAKLQEKTQAAQQNQCGSCGQPKPDGDKQSQPQQGQGSSGNQPSESAGNNQPQDGEGSDSGGSEQGQSGGQTGQAGNGSCCSECGQNEPQYKGCGSGSGGQGWSGELDPSDDFGGAAPSMSPAEQQAVKIATAAAIKDHVAKGRGTVPGGLVELSEKILAPSKTPWQKILASAVRRTVASKSAPYDTDRSRRHRRKHNMTILTAGGRRKVVMPAYHQPIPSIHLIRDTSGSMSATDIAVVTRECEAIARKMGVRGDQFKVTDVDAAVHKTVKFNKGTDLKEVAGRGGTDMRVGIEAAWASKDRPSVIVVATDGGTPYPQVPGPVPVIIALVVQEGMRDHTDQLVEMVPDWMKVVVVEPGEER